MCVQTLKKGKQRSAEDGTEKNAQVNEDSYVQYHECDVRRFENPMKKAKSQEQVPYEQEAVRVITECGDVMTRREVLVSAYKGQQLDALKNEATVPQRD